MFSLKIDTVSPAKRTQSPSIARSTDTSLPATDCTAASKSHSLLAMSGLSSPQVAVALVMESSFSETTSLPQLHKAKATVAISNSLTIPLLACQIRGGGKLLSIRQIALYSHIIIISFHSFHPNRFSYFSCKSNIFLRNQQINQRKFCRLKFIYYFCSGIIKIIIDIVMYKCKSNKKYCC